MLERRGVSQLIWCVLVGVAFLACGSLARSQQAPAADQSAAAPTAAAQPAVTGHEAAGADLPDSPGTVASAQPPQDQQPGSPNSGTPSGSAIEVLPPQNSQAQSQANISPQRPVGTAAAEANKASGVAASQPAGIAIAPAKQHRVRTIVLRTGAIIGAGVAVGTVVALTAATPGKPPGAH